MGDIMIVVYLLTHHLFFHPSNLDTCFDTEDKTIHVTSMTFFLLGLHIRRGRGHYLVIILQSRFGQWICLFWPVHHCINIYIYFQH